MEGLIKINCVSHERWHHQNDIIWQKKDATEIILPFWPLQQQKTTNNVDIKINFRSIWKTQEKKYMCFSLNTKRAPAVLTASLIIIIGCGMFGGLAVWINNIHGQKGPDEWERASKRWQIKPVNSSVIIEGHKLSSYRVPVKAFIHTHTHLHQVNLSLDCTQCFSPTNPFTVNSSISLEPFFLCHVYWSLSRCRASAQPLSPSALYPHLASSSVRTDCSELKRLTVTMLIRKYYGIVDINSCRGRKLLAWLKVPEESFSVRLHAYWQHAGMRAQLSLK